MTKRFALSVLTVSWLTSAAYPEPSQMRMRLSQLHLHSDNNQPCCFNVTGISNSLTATHPTSTPGGSISKLTELGYTVETFQPVS
jgi:hypothetical protein